MIDKVVAGAVETVGRRKARRKEVAGLIRTLSRTINTRKVVREVSGVFDDAGVVLGDRVIINDGTGAKPIFMVGTVEKVYPQRRRIDVRLDNGTKVTEQIDNTPTGMLGFCAQKRSKADPIDPKQVWIWLDKNRWLSNAALDLIAICCD